MEPYEWRDFQRNYRSAAQLFCQALRQNESFGVVLWKTSLKPNEVWVGDYTLGFTCAGETENVLETYFDRCRTMIRISSIEEELLSEEERPPGNPLEIQVFPSYIDPGDNIIYLSREIDNYFLIQHIVCGEKHKIKLTINGHETDEYDIEDGCNVHPVMSHGSSNTKVLLFRSKDVPTLQQLCCRSIQRAVDNGLLHEDHVTSLPLSLQSDVETSSYAPDLRYAEWIGTKMGIHYCEKYRDTYLNNWDNCKCELPHIVADCYGIFP